MAYYYQNLDIAAFYFYFHMAIDIPEPPQKRYVVNNKYSYENEQRVMIYLSQNARLFSNDGWTDMIIGALYSIIIKLFVLANHILIMFTPSGLLGIPVQ